MRRPFFVANWKMNFVREEARSFCAEFGAGVGSLVSRCDIGIAPPYTCLETVASAFASVGDGVRVGAQNVHWLRSGAHTGEVSVPMLRELGARFVIVGHSERRQFYGETDETVAGRAKAAIEGCMTAIVCVGETRAEYEAGKTEARVSQQLEGSLARIGVGDLPHLVIAYEPVWAIGTGLAATPEITSKIHRFIRTSLEEKFGAVANTVRILYGGSTSPENIARLMELPDIDGALVGGASLRAVSFLTLIQTGMEAKKGFRKTLEDPL